MKEDFKQLVKVAKDLSDKFYAVTTNKKSPNPYYIGFGSPNSEILILGKEKGFDFEKNENQAFFESINNPTEWFHHIENGTTCKDKYLEKIGKYEAGKYNNVFIPYLEKINKGGHTWNKYKKVIQEVYPNNDFINNDFLKKCFISEINHEPSKWSKIREFNNEVRKEFLKHSFYRSFKVTILACADYLSDKLIEEIFDVEFDDDSLSNPRYKFVVYKSKDESRLLINTRQLSTAIKNSYIKEIGEYIKKIGIMTINKKIGIFCDLRNIHSFAKNNKKV